MGAISGRRKRCADCRKLKEASEFGTRNGQKIQILYSYCLDCKAKQDRRKTAIQRKYQTVLALASSSYLFPTVNMQPYLEVTK